MQTIFFLVIVLLVITAYWSLFVFPRQREFKKHVQYVQTLKVGDEVITYGGLIGTITELDQEVGVGRIRFAENVEVRILTAALTRPFDPEEIARNIRMAQGISDTQEASRAE